jgi:hypothetical protein
MGYQIDWTSDSSAGQPLLPSIAAVTLETWAACAARTRPLVTLPLASKIKRRILGDDPRGTGEAMSDALSMIGEIDRLCGQIAIAMHNAEFQSYATLALAVIVSVLLFPPRDDLDQV